MIGENEWKRTENVGRIAMLNKMAREMVSASGTLLISNLSEGRLGLRGWPHGDKEA